MASSSSAKPTLWVRLPSQRTVVKAHLEHVAGTFRAAGWRVIQGLEPPQEIPGHLAVLQDPWSQPLPTVASRLARASGADGCWRVPQVNGQPGPQGWTLRNGPYTPDDYARLALRSRLGQARPLDDPWCGFLVAAAEDAEELLATGQAPAPHTVRWVPGALMYRYDDPAGHAREELDRFIPQDARTLVDIGCGHGLLGSRHRRPGRRVIGIEPDWTLARLAAPRLDVVLPLTAQDGLAALKEEMDCIVFADVLEHTTDAAGILRATARALSPDGRLIISVPNVAWAPVLRSLAAGRWDPTLAGTLARDHFTHFTRASFAELAQECGLRLIETSSLDAPLPWSLRLWAWWTATWAGGDPKDLRAAQWIFVLKRR